MEGARGRRIEERCSGTRLRLPMSDVRKIRSYPKDPVRMLTRLTVGDVRRIMSYLKGCGLSELAQCACGV